MYKGYNLILDENKFESIISEYKCGLTLKNAALMYKQENNHKLKGLQDIIRRKVDVQNGVINAIELEGDWFPAGKFDVFVSHSHSNETLACALAWWIEKNFGLRVFVDSVIWNYANDLLKQIDQRFCRDAERKCYIYARRNISTSHVHMMLNCALMKMIDATECLMFLNTPDSVIMKDDLTNKIVTGSCWLYDELLIANMIRKRIPSRVKVSNKKVVMDSKLRMPRFDYTVTVQKLQRIDCKFLHNWYNENIKSKGYQYPLDVLYGIK